MPFNDLRKVGQMATAAQWVEGARPKTLPAAIAPVLAGAAIAAAEGVQRWGLAALCLVVALALQIAVNYANDYSDGVRGTDKDRVGPMRLVGSGVASPAAVKRAAFVAFGVAALAGLVLVAVTGHWWLLGVGAASILAAWFYTGGSRPYGYLGLGELFVFVFFGLVAVGGTCYILLGRVPVVGWLAAVSVGALASAILVANNLRDIAGDTEAGKRTLATRLGQPGTRALFVVLVAASMICLLGVAFNTTWWALIALAGLWPASAAVRAVAAEATGAALVRVLKQVGQAELLIGVGLLAGCLIGAA